MLSPLRTRLNQSRKLQPRLINGSTFQVPSATSDKVYTVTITTCQKETTDNISHPVYRATCTCPATTVCEHSMRVLVSMARLSGKKITFCTLLKNALLKRKIYKGSLVKVTTGGKVVWAVAYREN